MTVIALLDDDASELSFQTRCVNSGAVEEVNDDRM